MDPWWGDVVAQMDSGWFWDFIKYPNIRTLQFAILNKQYMEKRREVIQRNKNIDLNYTKEAIDNYGR